MTNRTRLYTTTGLFWTALLLFALAYVFSITGCAPPGHSTTYTLIQGPKGDTGVQGPTGNAGPTGPRGLQGLTIVGPQGPAGIAGLNGTNASIGIVPLCPGVSNYGTFVEIGLCINHDLYGVYSANGGFMTYLAPGNYSSNAIGSACNLTVHTNCVVAH